jgi:hypothetical protein
MSRRVNMVLLLVLALGVAYGRLGVPSLLTFSSDDPGATAEEAAGQQSLPTDWRITEIAQGVSPDATPERTYVLAWQRNKRVEKCLVLCLINKGHDSWLLASVSRGRNGWKVVRVRDLPTSNDSPTTWTVHARWFQRPSNEVIYHFTDTIGFKLRDAVVCTATWEAIVKEAPTRK